MGIITLTTDLGNKDYYLSTVKGKIYSLDPEASIVDISNDIPPFDLNQACYALENSFEYFPEGSVHIIGVHPSKYDQVRHLACLYRGQYFIGADNGIFSLLFQEKPEKIHQIESGVEHGDDPIFEIREIFSVAAVHLASGGEIEDLGERGLILTERARLRPIVNPSLIKGHVINIDSYENAITNISRSTFEETVGDRGFQIYANPTTSFKDIKKHYNEVPVGEIVALFGSSGLLEIGINQFNHEHNGGASSLLGMNIKDVIRIEIE